MKTPDVTDFTKNKIPAGYDLRLSTLEELGKLSGHPDPFSEALWLVIAGAYRWGFNRGVRYQQKNQKAKK